MTAFSGLFKEFLQTNNNNNKCSNPHRKMGKGQEEVIFRREKPKVYSRCSNALVRGIKKLKHQSDTTTCPLDWQKLEKKIMSRIGGDVRFTTPSW